MQRWEYCEIEIVYKGSGAEAAMFLLRPDGSHAESSGRYGETMAKYLGGLRGVAESYKEEPSGVILYAAISAAAVG